MNTKHLISTDYKKWLLYSLDNQNWDTYYNLFKALKSGENFGSILIKKSEDSGSKTYTVSLDGVSEELQITEEQRNSLVNYLITNYFHTEEVDEIMVEKRQRSEMANNHNYLEEFSNQYGEQKLEYKVKSHPKETTYFTIKLVISIFFYAVIIGLLVYGGIADLRMLFSLFAIVPIILVLVLMNIVIKGIFIGLIRGNSIRVTKEQFPEIYEIIEEQARQLKIKDLPEIYITSGHFNAFVTKLSRAHILMIYSEVIETALKGNYDVLKYVTAHELCHIKQKHLTKEKYLWPSRIVPFLNLAYSRGCEYTCDRVGYHFSPKGSIEGILIMTTGKEIHSKFNIALHIKNAIENEGFWTWLSEKFLTHPHLYKRLIQVKNYSKYN